MVPGQVNCFLFTVVNKAGSSDNLNIFKLSLARSIGRDTSLLSGQTSTDCQGRMLWGRDWKEAAVLER